MKKILIFIFGLNFSILMYAKDQHCIVDTAQNNDNVKITAKLFNAVSPVFIRPTACPEKEVILVYGDNPVLGDKQLPIKYDDDFIKFKQLTQEEAPDTEEYECLRCPKYDITADFEGKLEILPYAGWVKDPKTGKKAQVGFGTIVFLSRYRLILTSVSNINAVERKIIP